MSNPSANPSERLVDHALSLRWSDVDPGARTAARTFLHDSLCVGAYQVVNTIG